MNPLNELPDDPTTPPDKSPSKDPTKRVWEEFKSRIDVCKSYRRKLVSNWLVSIDMRRGKPFSTQTDESRVNVPLDWSLTKAKQSALFSQVPQVRITHPPNSTDASSWLHAYEQKINDTLISSGIESAMDEVLPDVINAAGIGAILVAYEAITQDKEVPSVDLSTIPKEMAAQILQSKMLPDGSPLPMETVPEVVDKRYTIDRISPADLLWPINFTGSDFDKAPWVGRSGRITWAEAVKKFNLTEGDKENVLGAGDTRNSQDKLTRDIEKDKIGADEMVGFDEIFYKDIQYDVEAKAYNLIHHLVFIPGKDEPVVDEPWKGQRPGDDGKLVGATKFPLRILTLTYITDETIPPSDSAIGRPQVNELNKLRTLNILQRESSTPLRWMDINRIDPSIQYSIMRGGWQRIIPVQGQGDKIIGEVPRSAMPQENYAFDKITKSDLSELWSVGANQTGTGTGIDTKGEADIIEANFQTRIGRERALVGKHFCSIAEVLGGLISLYEDPTSFGDGFDPLICRTLSFSILADSTVLLDSNQKLKRLMDFINFSAKSGWVNIEPVLKEIATLSGLDPNQVIRPPQPTPPAEPSISLRLTGAEDLTNPIAYAILMKAGQAPTLDMIMEAKKAIEAAVMPPVPPPPVPVGPDGQPLPPPPPDGSGGPGGPPLPPGAGLPTGPPGPVPPPLPPPPAVGDAHQNWEAMPRINKRSSDGKANE